MPGVRCATSLSSSNANTTVSSRLCILTTRQNSLVVISTAACVRKALSSPALHRTRQSRTDWRKISTKSCLLAYGAFSIMPRCVRSCGARLLTTLCTYSTSHRHGRLVLLLHMKLRMEMCLMSASFACLAVFATLPHHKKLENKAMRATNLGHIGYGKYRLLLPGLEYKIFIATSVKFDEEVFDNATDAAKEVTGISNAAGGDDIISNANPLLDSDDVDVNTQDMPIKTTMFKDRRWTKLVATLLEPVQRRAHGFLPLARHELQTRRLSLWIWRLPTRTNGSKPLTRKSARWRMQTPGPWFHTSPV
jgi:hypothetical protein